MPNKPTLIGSRGSEIPQGYFNKNPAAIATGLGSGSNASQGSGGLPNLNNPYQSSVAKNSAVGASRGKSLPPGAPGAPSGSYMPTYKYTGMTGAIGGGGPIGGDIYNEQNI